MSKQSRNKIDEENVAIPPDAEGAANESEGEGETEPSPDEALVALRDELQAANDRYLRAKAELENFRKRAQRDLVEARDYIKNVTLQEFFSPFDHFQMAVAHVEEAPDLETMKQGMKMILSEFQRSFENLGVATIDATGKPFNPEEHEAVAQETSADVPPGTVLRQWKCGYKLGDKLLRPASVVVSGGDDEQISDDETE